MSILLADRVQFHMALSWNFMALSASDRAIDKALKRALDALWLRFAILAAISRRRFGPTQGPSGGADLESDKGVRNVGSTNKHLRAAKPPHRD